MFNAFTSFNSATFGDGARFDSVTFRNSARFDSATFGDGARFDSASFITGVQFDSATFGDGARFDSAEFGALTSFESVTFGEYTDFNSVTFGEYTDFNSVTFGIGPSFSSSIFSDYCSFKLAKFGADAFFGSVTFGYGALFDSATFGEGANFDSARFGPGLSMIGTGFEPPGGIDGIVVAERSEEEAKTLWGRILQRTKRLARLAEWNRARTLGDLQILTKATYAALVIVPLVAGAWQAMRVVLNGVAHEARLAKQELDASASRFQAVLQKWEEDVPPAEQRIRETRELFDQVRERIERLEVPETRTKPYLPVSWVLGYMAALCVVVGHFVYQTRAPEEVRNASRNAFRERRNAEFREASDLERRDLIERAFPLFRDVAERLPHDRHPNLVKRHGKAMWLPPDWQALEIHESIQAWEVEDGDKSSQPRPKYNRRQLELVLIDEGAAAEYDLKANEDSYGALVSLLLYFAGAVFVFGLILCQLNAVLTSAGFHAPSLVSAGLVMVVLVVVVAKWLAPR